MSLPFPTIPERIQWHEGMLLAPQHFQQSQARTDGLVAWQSLAAAPLAWGLRRLEIDLGLLAAGRARVLALDAVMPDGSAVWHDSADAQHGTLELLLEPHLDALTEGPQDLWLTLPWARAMRDPAAPSRFMSLSLPPQEDEVSDAAAADLPRMRPQLGLVLGAAPSSLWQRLRLGQLVMDQQVIRLGDELPPRLVLPREAALWQRAWALAAQLRAKAAFVARQTDQPSSRLEDRLNQLEHRDRLRALVAALAPLEAVLQTPSLHPYALYLALCQALGPLATLSPGALPMLPPAYDQDRPGPIFEALLAALEDAAAEVSPDHRLEPFYWRDGSFGLPMLPAWLAPKLVVGLRGQSERDLAAWMAGAVIGSASAWASLRERRVLGAARKAVEAAPDLGLRSGGGYSLYAIDAGSVLAGEPLLIGNANESQSSQRPAEIVLFVKG